MNDRELLENKVVLRPDEVAQILRISKANVYKMVRQKKIRGIKVGRAIRIATRSVITYMGIEE